MWTKLLSKFPIIGEIRTYIYLAIIVAIFTIVGLGYLHYNGLINKLSAAQAENTALKITVDTQEKTIARAGEIIDKWDQAQKDLVKTFNDMQKASIDANKEFRRLNDTFSKHNLAQLSSKRPKLIETLINRGTADSLRVLRCSSSGNKDSTCGVQDSKGSSTTGPGTDSGAGSKVDSAHP